MPDRQSDGQEELLSLPDDAPRIRITAGVGTAGQKTWYLRRRITLIGSRRRAPIVLHGEGVAPAHCAIINTGSTVLLKDLHTDSGTLCNDSRIHLAVLHDGDLLQVGSTPIQVAIRACRSRSRQPYQPDLDPLKLREPIRLHRPGGSQGWLIDENCAVIGRTGGVAVRLEHEAVSGAHAMLVALDGEPALFDLASETGTFRNGQSVNLCPIGLDDHLRVGPFDLHVVSRDAEQLASTEELATLGLIGEELGRVWHRLNDWNADSPEGGGSGGADNRAKKIAAREEELDHLDALLRGRLHDLGGYQQELVVRERELAEQVAAERIAQDRLAEQAAELEKLKAALAQRERRLEAHRAASVPAGAPGSST